MQLTGSGEELAIWINFSVIKNNVLFIRSEYGVHVLYSIQDDSGLFDHSPNLI